jgi:hypothetical protein
VNILPSAVKTYKFGKVFSQPGIKFFLIGAVVMTSFSIVLWLGAEGRGNPDTDLFTMLNIVITVIVASVYGLGRFLLRKRTINGETFPPERYAFIADELRRRGINRISRFITEHPDHVHCAHELSRELGLSHGPAYRTVMYRLESLIYSEDTDPARTKDALFSIIADRRITDQHEVRELLHTLLRTETPLGAGAL